MDDLDFSYHGRSIGRDKESSEVIYDEFIPA